MLKKLCKYEFKSIMRTLLPIYLAVIAVSLINAVSLGLSSGPFTNNDIQIFDGTILYWILGLMQLVVGFAYFAVLVALFVLTMVVILQRFYKGLLCDEGYLMFTLPVSVHQHIWSKLIVSAVWFAATILAIIAASMIVAYDVGFLRDFFSFLREFFQGLQRLKISEALNGTIYLVEFAVLLFLSMAALYEWARFISPLGVTFISMVASCGTWTISD